MKFLSVRNQQRVYRIATRDYKRAATIVLEQLLNIEQYRISVSFVSPTRMTALNEGHLGHEGATDIITFDYSENDSILDGELLLCPEIAAQYAKCYQVTLGRELARYFIHGVLHLTGHDDRKPEDRRRMKRVEQNLLNQLSRRHPIDTLSHG